ncbi:streptomycin 3'-adenylyltransferase [Sphingobacterium yanglingense]|uniref:Streptomycin 3'-adenylyltransferase n=2 Tax=Sphingobacterium yanglingense TaxID=1437280 RepID=A0A4R6WMM0_9SPHI|nr:streptomycin 3'-adenylyltransferase [Sphingobacterium yanglingense]
MHLYRQLSDLNMSLFDSEQLVKACSLIKNYLEDSLMAIHLYGSAVEGGLKPYSDIDLFVTIDRPMTDDVRLELMQALLAYSAIPGAESSTRALEVTVVNYQDVVPWKYPPRRQMQFGEWLREDILAGVVEPALTDIDLCILIKKLRTVSVPIVGPDASLFFEPVPEGDFLRTLKSTLDIWNTEEDWLGDERNVILTIARIWFSASAGEIASKEDASSWLISHLPRAYQSLVAQARQQYLIGEKGELTLDPKEVLAFINFAKQSIRSILLT